MEVKWPDDYIPDGFTPYHQEECGLIFNCDCRDILPHLPKVDLVLTDPPFNVGYHYNSYKDNLLPYDYQKLIEVGCRFPSIIIHYPEDMFKISNYINCFPSQCVSWVYNSNTPREHRMIAWFGCFPDFALIKQPYKNQNDKRILAKQSKGEHGTNIYDWWYINQVKNISSEKTEHPCQIPLQVMKNIVTTTPSDIFIDPFLGSGTTAVAAKELGRRFIGVEISETYCQIAVKRLKQCNVLPFSDEHDIKQGKGNSQDSFLDLISCSSLL